MPGPAGRCDQDLVAGVDQGLGGEEEGVLRCEGDLNVGLAPEELGVVFDGGGDERAQGGGVTLGRSVVVGGGVADGGHGGVHDRGAGGRLGFAGGEGDDVRALGP